MNIARYNRSFLIVYILLSFILAVIFGFLAINLMDFFLWGTFLLFSFLVILFVYLLLAGRAEISIDENFLRIHGLLKFRITNIVAAAVVVLEPRQNSEESPRRCLQIQFREKPEPSFTWYWNRFWFRGNETELEVAPEPRLLIPLNPTDVNDAEIDERLSKALKKYQKT